MAPRIALAIAILAPSLFAQARFAGQAQTGSRLPLPGVRISVRPAGGPLTEIVTGPQGRFEIVAPGAGPFQIGANKDGFYPVRSELAAAPDSDIILTLEPIREQTESLDVSAAPSAVDMDSTATRRTMTNRDVVNIPYSNTNDLKQALKAMPGIVRDNRGGVHINGAAEDQVLYTLNGFNLNDPLTNRFDARLSVEAVQSMEVTSGNLPAEFGKGSAGTLAIRTQTGDDKFRFLATNFFPGIENRKKWTITDWTPRLGFSGPIRRGRTWVSNNADLQFAKTIIRDLPVGEDKSVSERLSNLLHVQHNASPSNILSGSLLVNLWRGSRQGLGRLDPVETTVDRRARQWFFNLKDQIYLGRGALMEVGYAANRTFGREIPQGTSLLLRTAEGRRGNFFADGTQRGSRDQLLFNLFLPSFTWAGSHRLKLGSDLDHVAYWQDVRRTGIETYSEAGSLTRRTLFGGNGLLRRSNSEASLYLQDSWRLRPALLLELGARADWDRILGAWSTVPRVGLAWSPGRLQGTRFHAGYARVADVTNLRLFTRPQDQYSLTTFYSPDGPFDAEPSVTQFFLGSALSRPLADTWSLGATHLWNGLTFRADLLRRQGRRGFVYTAAFDQVMGLGDIDYRLFNHRRDSFDSVSVSVRQVIGRQYEWMASYTRSHARSNNVVDVSAEDPIFVAANAGPLAWDAPHRFLGWGYLPLPRKNWAVAWLADARSGFPFSRFNNLGQVVGPVNAMRFPFFFEMNLHLERRFTYLGHQWAFRFGANNLTGRINPDTVNNITDSSRYLQFFGGNGRAMNVRIRWLGKTI